MRRIFERGRPGEPVYVSRDLGITPRDNRLKAVRKDTSVIGTLAMLNVPLVMEITENLDHMLAATNIVYHQNWMLPIEAVVELFVQYPDIKKRVIQEIQRNDIAIKDIRIAGNGTGEEEVLFEHRGLDTPVPLFGESGGTKRMFYLLPQIYIALNNGVASVIDEIDGDLHVDIVRQILQRFQSRETNPHNAQLFVTSHNVGLLDDIEKEELFIVEKGEDGGTVFHGVQEITGFAQGTSDSTPGIAPGRLADCRTSVEEYYGPVTGQVFKRRRFSGVPGWRLNEVSVAAAYATQSILRVSGIRFSLRRALTSGASDKATGMPSAPGVPRML